MRVVLQRVSRGEVRIDGEVAGSIGRGFLLLVGFTKGDAEEQLAWMVEKVRGLRLFSDAEGKMNLALEDVGGELLVVSQFTLYGDVRKGRRPCSFMRPNPQRRSGFTIGSSSCCARGRSPSPPVHLVP